MQYVKSPLNYTGGKYKLLDELITRFPKNINKFVDLFTGGLNVGINVSANKIYVNDEITYIIDLYEYFSSHSRDDIVNEIKKRISEYHLTKEDEDAFNKFRQHYNDTRDILDLFILTCFSFNNQMRFNSKHEFNKAFGKRCFSEVTEHNLIEFVDKLHNNEFVFSKKDFREFDFFILKSGDFVYCDPPYLISTGSYNDGKRGFSDWTAKDDSDLFDILDSLNKSGVQFALSNVFIHHNQINYPLIRWSEKYKVNFIDKSYSSCFHNVKEREALTVEVLITNYECGENVDVGISKRKLF